MVDWEQFLALFQQPSFETEAQENWEIAYYTAHAYHVVPRGSIFYFDAKGFNYTDWLWDPFLEGTSRNAFAPEKP